MLAGHALSKSSISLKEAKANKKKIVVESVKVYIFYATKVKLVVPYSSE